MDYRINVDDAIPDFKAKDEEGNELTAEDLFGTPVVLYFYPKDDTPGCTKEACHFRDSMDRLSKEDVVVIGVSPDNAASHQKFIQKHGLNFSLLTDESHDLSKKFDVLKITEVNGQKKMGYERTTFLIDRDGIVRWIERPVNVEGHVERVIDALKDL
jgi:thioredoxin-dependent peroxiredoxin